MAKDREDSPDGFFEPEEPNGEDPATFLPGRPVTVIAPEVPRAKSSVPYVTIGLAVLAVVATVTIALLVNAPADDPTKDEAVAARAESTIEPEPESSPAPEPERDVHNRQPDAPVPKPGESTRVTAKKELPAGPHEKSVRDRARMQYGRGNAYLRKNRVAAAIASYERALELDPSFAEVHGPLGVAYTRAGKTAKAQGAFDAYFQGTPQEARAEAKRKLIQKFSKK